MSTSTLARRAMWWANVLTLVIGWGAISSGSFAFGEHVEFTFYLHDNLLSPANASAFGIVPPLETPILTSNPPVPQSFFGTVVVFDDSITTDPDPSSLEIGRGRGIYVFDANDTRGAAIEFLWTAEFNAASAYGDGSTLTFKGFDRTLNPVREIAIVGGTGTFRLARGWAVITTYSQVGIGTANLKIDNNVFYGF